MPQICRFHKLVHNFFNRRCNCQEPGFWCLDDLGQESVRAEELCLSKICQKLWLSILASLLPWIHQWLGWHFVVAHSHDKLMGKEWKEAVYFFQSTCFRCMEIDAKVNEFYLWHGTHIRAALSIAREAKGLCPKWIVRCALWHRWKKEDDLMDVYFFGCCWDVN